MERSCSARAEDFTTMRFDRAGDFHQNQDPAPSFFAIVLWFVEAQRVPFAGRALMRAA